MKAVVLAGGFGKRLAPLTNNIPKPMLPVLNNPLIDYQIRLLHRHEVSDIHVALCYLPQQIVDFLNQRYGEGAFEYSIESAPLGTAGSVYALRDKLNQTFVVLSADTLCDINLRNMLSLHKQSGALCTIASTSAQDASLYGVVSMDKNKVLTSFLEKPDSMKNQAANVNCGIYIFEPRAREYFAKSNADFGRDVLPEMLKNKEKICVFDSINYWQDIGDFNGYFQANYSALNHNIAFKAFEGGLEAILKEADSFIDCKIAAVVRHRSAKISPQASLFPCAVIAKNCTLESGVVVANSIVLENTNLRSSAINCIAYSEGKIALHDYWKNAGFEPPKIMDFAP